MHGSSGCRGAENVRLLAVKFKDEEPPEPWGIFFMIMLFVSWLVQPDVGCEHKGRDPQRLMAGTAECIV